MQRSQKLLLAILLFAISGAGALFLLARDSYPRLETIAVATPLPTRVSWYDWIDDTETLLGNVDRASRVNIQKLNVASGIVQPVKAMNDGLAKLDIQEMESLSPDHQWVSCSGFPNAREGVVDFVSVEGSPHTVSSEYAWAPGKVEGAWAPDSRHWIFQRTGTSGITLIEFAHDGSRKTTKTALPVKMANPHILGIAPDGAVILGDFEWEYNTPAVQQVPISQYRYGTTQKIREDTIVFPCAGKIWNIALDPRGERILWQLRVDLKASRPMWLRQTMRLLGVTPRSNVINLFWVCNVDGSNGKAIGFLDIGKQEDADNIPARCRWLPSGKKFSFVSGKTLWVVPVDK